MTNPNTTIPSGGIGSPGQLGVGDPGTPPTSFYANPGALQFDSLIYPDDKNRLGFYPECVCFTIQKRTGVSIEDVGSSLQAVMKSASDSWNGKLTQEQKKSHPELAGILQGIKHDESSEKSRQEVTEAAITTYKKNHPDHTLPDSMADLIATAVTAGTTKLREKQTQALELKKGGANELGHIYLNMPNGIQFAESANWAGQELGFMGHMTKDFVSGGSASGDAMKALTGAGVGAAGGMIGAAVGAIPSLVSKLGISGGMFGAALGAMAAGSPIQKGLESAMGVAQNPYLEMMFSGIGFRKFQFEFIFRPKSSSEFETVAKILKMFRSFSKPTFAEGKLGKSFMNYPMEFGIKFLREEGGRFTDNLNVPKIKDCVCDSVTSNFTPQSIWAAHEQGKPVAVNLSLSFQETELVMAEDVWKDASKGGGY